MTWCCWHPSWFSHQEFRLPSQAPDDCPVLHIVMDRRGKTEVSRNWFCKSVIKFWLSPAVNVSYLTHFRLYKCIDFLMRRYRLAVPSCVTHMMIGAPISSSQERDLVPGVIQWKIARRKLSEILVPSSENSSLINHSLRSFNPSLEWYLITAFSRYDLYVRSYSDAPLPITVILLAGTGVRAGSIWCCLSPCCLMFPSLYPSCTQTLTQATVLQSLKWLELHSNSSQL